jgi:hypothetical protein
MTGRFLTVALAGALVLGSGGIAFAQTSYHRTPCRRAPPGGPRVRAPPEP